MRAGLELFFTALGYFTRLPVPAWVPWSSARLRLAAACLPLVGWLVGALGAAAYALLAQVLPATLAVILSMAATIRLTGALHEDGWADACDGLGGGWDKAQVLAIMKDSRIGSYGALALVLALGIKIALLAALAGQGAWAVAAAMLSAHVLSRLAPLAVIRTLPHVGDEGTSKSKPLADALSGSALAVGAAWSLPALLPVAAAFGAAKAAAMVAAAALAALWMGRLLRRRLQGFTGDGLGATQQLAELAVFLALAWRWPA